MTVIATDGFSMAGDGRCVAGWVIDDDKKVKVRRVGDKIAGGAGDAVAIEAFHKWLADPSNPTPPKVDDSFCALVLNADGTLVYYTNQFVPLPVSVPAAIGCGAAHALTAMDLGASPRDAVKAAIKRNIGCGGLITSLDRKAVKP